MVITTTFCGSVQNEHDHILWMILDQSTKSVGFVTENIMVRRMGKTYLEYACNADSVSQKNLYFSSICDRMIKSY